MGASRTQIGDQPGVPLVPELSASRIPHTFRALRHRNFRLFLGGQIISLVGTWMQNVAQSWLVYRLTHSELLLGTAWFCSQIAVFALGPLGGIAADRFSRRKVVIVTQTLSMLQAFGLAALTLSDRVQVWHVLAFAGALGVINAFDMPGRQALVIEMTSKEDLINAISLNSAVFNAARVVGPAVAGIVLAYVGEGTCFLINGISFLAVIVCLAAMRLPPAQPKPHVPMLEHLVDGFRYAARHSAVRRVLALMAAATLSGMPGLVLMPFFADGIFHRGSRGLGILMGAMGVGAVIGTLVLARRTRLSGLARVMTISGVTTGACYLLFAYSPSFYLSLAIMPVIGYSVMRQMASANTTIQTLIPDEYRGRIMALYAMTVVGLGPFGSLAAGALAGRFGPRSTMAAGGVLALSASLVFAWYLRRDPIAA
uniref:Major facilitator superfamily MFS_1 n=1 Tax=Solibacter usitatus (strain Ellin6076) TaxID=234267 RepID=Q028T7_SOLUE